MVYLPQFTGEIKGILPSNTHCIEAHPARRFEHGEVIERPVIQAFSSTGRALISLVKCAGNRNSPFYETKANNALDLGVPYRRPLWNDSAYAGHVS
jgi:hypothetical protein